MVLLFASPVSISTLNLSLSPMIAHAYGNEHPPMMNLPYDEVAAPLQLDEKVSLVNIN
jgi:hypothetical protein